MPGLCPGPGHTPSKAAALVLPEEALLGRICLLFFPTNTLQSAVKRHLGLLVPGKCFLQPLPLMFHGGTLPTGTLLCPQPYIYILFSTHMNFKHKPCHATVSRPPQQPTILLEAQFLRVARKRLSNLPASAIKSAGHIRPLGILWVLGDTALAIPVLGKAPSR